MNKFQAVKKTAVVVAAVAAFGIFGAMGISTQASASANPDNDIVRGGIYGKDLASKCTGDVATIMAHYRIDCNLAGVVDGRTCKDGNVYVGDRVVARNAQSIGRQVISGSHPISIGGKTYHETPNSAALLSNCIDAFVKLDQHGSFTYAIIKACGNPIWTPSPVVVTPPTTPPPTTPPAAMIQVCHLGTKQIITIKESDYNSSWHSRNFKVCQKVQPLSIQVCEIATKKLISIKDSEFNAQLHSKNLADCQVVPPTPTQIQVCEIASKKLVMIDEKDFNAQLHSKNLQDCDVCPYNASLPLTSPDCKETVTALPQTGGIDQLLGAGLGIGSTIIAASFYIASRRDLLSAFLG